VLHSGAPPHKERERESTLPSVRAAACYLLYQPGLPGLRRQSVRPAGSFFSSKRERERASEQTTPLLRVAGQAVDAVVLCCVAEGVAALAQDKEEKGNKEIN
jgi:hypothetical protein